MKRSYALLLSLSLLGSIVVLGAAAPAQAATPPVHCSTKTNQGKDFRYCSGLVTSKDGSVKLDTDVTLPGKGTGPYPVIVMLHGLGGWKGSYESIFKGQRDRDRPSGTAFDPANNTIAGVGGRYHYNNQWFASHGYAVLNYTVRGFDKSACIEKDTQSTDANDTLYPPASSSPACQPQLVSKDHEVKDTQYLVGRLIDRTLIDQAAVRFKRKKVGVTGVSYGGGHTWLLTRKNTWFSPKGHRIKLAAAVPIIGWTDLVEALVPNGKINLDWIPPLNVADREAQGVGVAKHSFVQALFYLMQKTAEEPFDLPSYLDAWYNRFYFGSEPYTDDVSLDAIHSLLTKRSAFYVPTGDHRTPTYAVQGFNDEIFPVIQAVSMFNYLKSQDPAWPVRLYAGDWGHPRSQNKDSETRYINRSINDWLNHYLKDKGSAPAAKVQARTTVCDSGAMGALYQARTWDGLSGGVSAMADPGPFTLDTSANDPHQVALDPVRQNGDPDNACRTMDSDVATGNAAAEWPQADAVTMLGIPTVTATADPTADDLYIAARVWDVAPDGLTQTLVDRGVVRLGAAGTQSVSFHLNGNGYKFKAGHTIKLELTANDHPTFKAPANSGTISVTAVDFEMPVADATKLVP